MVPADPAAPRRMAVGERAVIEVDGQPRGGLVLIAAVGGVPALGTASSGLLRHGVIQDRLWTAVRRCRMLATRSGQARGGRP